MNHVTCDNALQNMIKYLYSFLKRLQIVKRALRLAKPTIPSLRNSYFMRSSRFNKPSEVNS